MPARSEDDAPRSAAQHHHRRPAAEIPELAARLADAAFLLNN